MKQAHVFVSGYVQGVGFRQFVKHNARKLGITGWVRNTSDGKVEAIMQAPQSVDQQKTIEELIALCRKGSFLAEVTDISVSWEEGEQAYTEFATRV